MNRESIGRILLILAVGLPGLFATWLLTQLLDHGLDQAADLRARVAYIEARQTMEARTLRTIQIAQLSDKSSMDFVKNMLSLHMKSTMNDDMRNWPVLLEIQSEIQNVKRDTDAMRAKIDPPKRLFGAATGAEGN